MAERDASGFRFERKYHVDYVPLPQIEHLVRRNPALFRTAYPDRTINNIYLDTPSRQSLLENLDGIADRIKARIRWYGEMLGHVEKPVLEFKIKRGMVGAKDSYRLVPFTVERRMNATVVHDALESSDLPVHIQFELKKFEPVLLNRYKRKYYISADNLYRITLDYDLEYYRFDRNYNLFTRSIRDYHSTVVELKYSGAIDQIDDRVASYFPFRVTRMSKFVTGVQSVHFD